MVAAEADTGTNEPSEVPERFVVRASDPDALAARCQNRFPVFNPSTGDLLAKVAESCGCYQGEISAATIGRLHFPPSSQLEQRLQANTVIRRLYPKTNGKAERFIQNALREALEILNGDRMTPVLPPAKSFGNILR
ncbi:hypothetical protein [Sinorhizobium meliloti]|uniref:hypothetical protein n=1 Tax=Rhizobium meliloti TaxID=382 RepID=UPI001295F49B|nr:hypothetical protein [Sinorhizobium meliloti]MQX90549.1 hypothetical protein [Sinorhizobium meliloti]